MEAGEGGVVCVKPAYKQLMGGEMHFRLNEISHLEDFICLSLKENITEDPSETFIQNENLNCFVLKNCEINNLNFQKKGNISKNIQHKNLILLAVKIHI